MNKDQRKIGERLEDLMKEKNITSKELSKLVSAKGVKLSEATLSDIINNVDKGYSYKIFVEISKQLGVSTDYLFGLSDVATNNTELKAVCHYTGLDEKSVLSLNHINLIWNRYQKYEKVFDFINSIIKFLDENQTLIAEYCYFYNEVKKLFPYVYDGKDDEINIDVLKSLGISLDDENINQDFYNILMHKYDILYDKLMICRYRLSTLFNNLFYDEQIDEVEKINTGYYSYNAFRLNEELSNLEKGLNKNEQE